MTAKKDRRQIYPKYSKQKVNNSAKNIGMALREHNGIVLTEDEEVVENWRASHIHVLNTWQFILRNRINGKKIIFAQRLKRKKTIYDKLHRFPKMLLARMHDIAGCRLIFRNEKDMLQYIENLHKSKSFRHIRKDGQCKDYITNPKESGYRGIHDVYAYQSKKGYDRSNKWDKLLVEIQYRTIYQHAWATAVEISDYLTSSRSKFSQGNEEQQEFLRLASEIIARAFENKKGCKSELSNVELIESFKSLDDKLQLLTKLRHFKSITTSINGKNKNIILHFQFKNGLPLTATRSYNSLSKAMEEYFKLEKQFPEDDIVLVKSSKIQDIKKTYKNYFADSNDFVGYVINGLEILKTMPEIETIPHSTTHQTHPQQNEQV